MGPFSAADRQLLLMRGEERFSADDERFITEQGGAYPYFVHAAAAAVWQAYGDEDTQPEDRLVMAGETLYNEASPTIEAM
jgi:hypothetical protein